MKADGPALLGDLGRQEPVDSTALLQNLIRFDTSNPPGKERALISYLESLLTAHGIATTVLGRDRDRPNLIARLPGSKQAPPLMMYGHADVVPASDQRWTHPPFAGVVADDAVWGRGALDMKGGVTMMVAAILRAAREELIPAGDVLLVVVADEEGGGDWGARWLVEHHPEQFTDVEHAIGEFGGFSLELMGRRFYPIQVSEKQRCWLRTAVHGPGGHGALVGEQLAMRRLADLLGALTGRLLPVHVTPPAGEMIGAIARALPGPARLAAAALSHDSTAPLALRLMGDRSELFQPLLRNTVSPTVVRGGTVTNVVPSRVDLELDGRLLPGFRPSDLLDELTAVVGDDFEFEVTDFEPGPQHTDMRLFDLLAEIVVSQDPEGVPIPMLLSGVTDGRYFARLGIQTYGFIPMSLPPGFGFTSLIHSADERIPLSSLEFGVDTLYELLRRYGRQ